MKRLTAWIHRHRRILIISLSAVVAIIIFAQLLYPVNRLLPFASIDGLNVSAWKTKDATWKLDEQLNNKQLAVYVGNTDKSYDTPKPQEIGLTIDNKARVAEQAYPWYIRLIPTSLLWYQAVQADGMPQYNSDKKAAARYLDKQLGKSCNIPAKDASLEFKDKSLKVVSATDGGTCKEAEALDALVTTQPVLSKPSKITIPVTITKPNVSDETAQKLANDLTTQSKDGIPIEVAGKTQTISQQEVLSWLDFKTKGNTLRPSISIDKSNAYMTKTIAPLVMKPAGQTTIETVDFTEVARSVGATGKTLALTTTLLSIADVLEGKSPSAKASVTDLAPKVSYKRSYSKTSTGIAALIAHYDEDNAGVFGVSFQELGGQARSAQHNGSRVFTTASTYKLFVAYGTLRNIDSGKWKWSMQVQGGRDLTKCFDDMIVKSDNACAEALLKKLGYSQLTKDIRAIGLASSGFVSGDSPQTTANDLGLFLNKLQNSTLPLKSASRTTLLNAMKRNVYRQGVPAGASGAVADKVGFLWALLHDASIVYSPKGTYVLVVMTDGSTWANIADLTRKIESLR